MAHAALAKVGVQVPITMCNGETASGTINTCNGNDCTSYLEQHGQNGKVLLSQPALWTENEGGFQTWGGAPPPGKEPYFWGRSIGDQALSIMKWFARGGSHMNYYMWAGGNQFGRWTGDAITTMYAVDAMVCPDGLPHEPKFTQMTAMHTAIAAVSDRIVGDAAQLDQGKKLSGGAVAYIYGGEATGVAFIECLGVGGSGCAGGDQPKVVVVNGHTFTLPTEESSSLVDLKTGAVLFNTQTMASHTSAPAHQPKGSTASAADAVQNRVLTPVSQPFEPWQEWAEPVMSRDVPTNTYAGNSSFAQRSPLEQTLFTMCLAPDPTDLGARSKRSTYAYYETTVDPASELTKLSIGTNQATTMFAFVDGVLAAHADELSHSNGKAVTLELDLAKGARKGASKGTGSTADTTTATATTLTILSEEMGYANYGFKHQLVKGISGSVMLGKVDITDAGWKMRGGLAGEHLAVFTAAGAAKVKWSPATPDGSAATWYKTSFTTPAAVASGAAKLLINATGLNRGRLWVNGHDVGRYFLDQRNAAVQCLSSFEPTPAPAAKCTYNTSAPYSGSQCLGLTALHAGDVSAASCADACCSKQMPTWQWSSKKDANGDAPGCWCGECQEGTLTPNPTWIGGHNKDSSTQDCATQTVYYVPKSWLLAAGSNQLVLFEGGGTKEVSGSISQVGLTLATMKQTTTEDTAEYGNRLDGIHSCAF